MAESTVTEKVGVDTSGLEDAVDRVCARIDALIEERRELIAVRDELLQACKDSLNYWTCTGFAECEVDCNCIVDQMRAAIAKAEQS